MCKALTPRRNRALEAAAQFACNFPAQRRSTDPPTHGERDRAGILLPAGLPPPPLSHAPLRALHTHLSFPRHCSRARTVSGPKHPP